MMPDADAARRKMDEYLRELRGALSRFPEREAHDIIEEIRSHIRDSSGTGGALSQESVTATLERLGPPRELASMYRMENLAERAERTRSPWLVLRTVFHWAGLSLRGAWALLVSLVGYMLSASFLICAVAKPFNPQRVGLWRLDEPQDSWSLHLGFRAAPPGAEVLGWWIVPLGLLVGAGLFLLTFRFGLSSLQRFRRTLVIPGR
jgi:HAAS domain-containing protein